MQIKQVYSCYEYEQNEGVGKISFCPVCGGRFEIKDCGDKKRPVCLKCGYIYYKNPSPAVSVLVVDDNKVLLGKRKQGSFLEEKWCLPCGYIEFNEDFLTAGSREVLEETGLNIEVDSIVNVVSNFLSPCIHSLVIVLVAHVTGGTPTPGDDICKLKWQDMSEPLPDMAFDADRFIIEYHFKTKIKGLGVDLNYINR